MGHSVSCMIGMLAVQKAPGMFGKLVMIGPSARYIDDEDYTGGFSEQQIEELLSFSNPIIWAGRRRWPRRSWAILIVRNSARNSPTASAEPILKSRKRSRALLQSDNRADLAKVNVPNVILECKEDIIASQEAGEVVIEILPATICRPGGYRALSQSKRARRSHPPCERSSKRRVAVPRIDDFEDMVEDGPCGYITLLRMAASSA